MSDFIDDEDIIGVYVKQIAKLNDENKLLRKEVQSLNTEIQAKDKLPLPKSVVKQIVQMEAIIQTLQNDLKYYKRFVPKQVIINREKDNNPTRRGGVPKG
jgi:Tfp pilus assembly protein PilN